MPLRLENALKRLRRAILNPTKIKLLPNKKTSKAMTAKHVLLTLSVPSPSSENPIDPKMSDSLLQKWAVLHATVQGSLMEMLESLRRFL